MRHRSMRGGSMRGGSMRGGSMRGRARVIAVVTMVLGLGLMCAPGATAGGTTSVLLTSPSSEEATAALNGSAKYRELETLLGPGTGDPEPPWSLDGALGVRQINVTWMAHDVSPTRMDQLFPGDDQDTLWIHTASSGLPDTFRGYWHRAERPRELAALLKELGLMGPLVHGAAAPMYPSGEDDAAGATEPTESTESTKSTESGVADPVRASVASDSRLDGWWWAIPGLLAGAVIALALRQRMRPSPGGSGGGRELGPRQQLLDL